MKRLILLFLTIYLCKFSFAQETNEQTDTTKSVYKKLRTKKFYSGSFFSTSTKDFTSYTINDQQVNKATYDKFQKTWKNMETCKPCIMLTYDINDTLLYKGIQYTDCPVGFWIEYFPNGKVKLIGHYKENETGNWDSIFNKGFCKPDGAWTYFNNKGEKLYSEYWKDGQFIKQVPEQSKSELWDVEVTYNGEIVKQQLFTPDQVKEFKITPKFKNALTDGKDITIRFEIVKYKTNEKRTEHTFSLLDFKTINIQEMLSKAEIKPSDYPTYTMTIFNNGVYFSIYWLNIKL